MNEIGRPRGEGSGGDRPSPGGPLPLVAVLLAFLVGPLGVGLAIWWLRNRSGEPSQRSLARTAVVIGVLQTLLVMVVVLVLAGRHEEAPGSPTAPSSTSTASARQTPTRNYPTTPPPSAPTGTPPAPMPPTATSLAEFVPASVYQYEWQAAGDDAAALEAGAVAAVAGTFDADDQAVTARMAQWPTPADATSFALAKAMDDFGDSPPLAEGAIRSGAGHYWYYERDGVGTLYWYLGSFSAEFSGQPLDVQEFFVNFPK